MALLRILLVDPASGRVVGNWMGDTKSQPEFSADYTVFKLQPDDTTDYSNKQWNGTEFVDVAVPAIRDIERGDFFDRFTEAEELAFEEIAEKQSQAGRVVRILMRKINARDRIRLDSPRLIAGMARLKQVGLNATPPVWPDAATADARIAQILS